MFSPLTTRAWRAEFRSRRASGHNVDDNFRDSARERHSEFRVYLLFFLGWSTKMRIILLIIVVVLLLGALPTWPYSAGWGYYPSGGLGAILIILLVLALLGII